MENKFEFKAVESSVGPKSFKNILEEIQENPELIQQYHSKGIDVNADGSIFTIKANLPARTAYEKIIKDRGDEFYTLDEVNSVQKSYEKEPPYYVFVKRDDLQANLKNIKRGSMQSDSYFDIAA